MVDLIIIGGGPAGLSASIYALRAKKSVLLIERMGLGGQVAMTTTIENYPGFELITGVELAEKMYSQAEKLGLKTTYSDVLEYDISGDIKRVKTHEGEFEAKAILLCLGASARQLDVKNEKKFAGRGISYCATCDGNFYRGKAVAVVGGGDCSIDETLYLSNIVDKIYLIHRGNKFKNENVDFQEIVNMSKQANPKVEILTNTIIQEVKGENKVQSIIVKNLTNKTEREINLDGIFVAIGRKPDTSLLKGIVNMDENGYILTDESMKTNVAGVYAAGDVRKKQLKQIVTACADGAIAVASMIPYLNTKK